MSAALQRRIKQLEKLVDLVATPEAHQEVVLLGMPAPNAPAQELEWFKRDVEAAKSRGAFVIVMVPLRKCSEVEDGPRRGEVDSSETEI
jgi:hypothetical protein